MKVKPLFTNPKDFSIENYFRKCGIDDIEEFINPTGKYLDNPTKYENMDKGVEFIKQLEQYNTIYIVQDSDVDGQFSAALIYIFLEHLGMRDIKVLFHIGKQHGLSDDIMEQIGDDCDFLIIPDAGSNDIEQCKELSERGIKILILDHHEVETKNPYAIVINNQSSPNVTNKDLCGTGVVFKFVSHYMGDAAWYNDSIGFVAIANVADSMSMASYENRTFNEFGLNLIRHPFIKAMYKEFVRGNIITPKDIGWSIAPKFNAVCRGNNQELKRAIFEAMTLQRSDYDELIVRLKEAHSEQSAETARLFAKAKDNIAFRGKVGLQIIESSPYTGLVANKILSHTHLPILLLHDTGDGYAGSARSPVDLRKTLQDSGLVDFAQGHERAFGVSFPKDGAADFLTYLDGLDLNCEPVEEVVIDTDTVLDIPDDMYRFAAEYKELFGNDVPEPKVCLRTKVREKDIKHIGKNGIKFKVGMTDVIKWVTNEELRDSLGGEHEVEIIGVPDLNEWNGRTFKQMIVDKMEIL